MTREAADLTIESIGAGGAGVGHLPDGRAVFVHRTAPGDEADVRIEVNKARWARARLVTLRSPGAERRAAPCPLYPQCGGCTVQHLEYAAQLRAKADIVAQALRRVGGIETAVPEVDASPTEFDYRNRATFTLVRTARGVVAGFHRLESPGRILDVDDRCMLLEPPLRTAWRALRDGWGSDANALPAGRELRLTLRSASGGCTLLIEGGRGRGRPEALLAAVPRLQSVWLRRQPGTETRCIAGVPTIDETWGDEIVHLRGGAFLQVNRAVATRLEAWVRQRAGDVSGTHVVDAYCGIGIHAGHLDRAGARVTGIELDPHARREAAARVPGATFLQGTVEALLPQMLPADLVIVNPPRAGLAEEACTALRERPPRRILYVSCDPATLARDVSRLGPVFTATSIRCFDMFPQTAHVETVLELECVTS